jgi:predicted dehydrogenase
MLRGAIIGLGNVALEGHLPGWTRRDDVEIVAVSDTERARRPLAGARVPAARWYDSAEELLAHEPLDFVDICTPPASHGPLVCRALERGLHVLCEKPLVVAPDDLTRVTRLAEATRRVVHTVHNWHHAPIIKRTVELVQQGSIGQVTRVVWQTLRTNPAAASNADAVNWRLDPTLGGGGVLTDHGWHVFYLLRSWIGGFPTSVSARLERRRHTASPVEDTATVHVTFPGATAEIFLTWAADRRDNVVELIGTDGRIELHQETLLLERDGRTQRWSCPPPLSNGSVHPDWFDPEVDRFLGEVTGVAERDSNLAEAWLCAVLERVARDSNRRGGQPIAMPSLPISMA